MTSIKTGITGKINLTATEEINCNTKTFNLTATDIFLGNPSNREIEIDIDLTNAKFFNIRSENGNSSSLYR
jgi:hypothetical protein